MDELFIHGVRFEWDKIRDDSYLKNIEAFKGISLLDQR